MRWKETAAALWLPIKACFDLTGSERRFLLALLVLFCLGLGAREWHRRTVRPGLYPPPLEQPAP